MKSYVVYGYIHGEGEFHHTYFLKKLDAEKFKDLWLDDKRYMDSIEMVEINHHEDICDMELRQLVKGINKNRVTQQPNGKDHSTKTNKAVEH